MAPTPAVAADQPLAENAENVTAYAGIAIWSHAEVDVFHRLRVIRNGVVSDLPVSRSQAPFDADIGPGPDGDPVAVYARCGSVDRCDVYSYDLTTGDERRIPQLARANCEETAPSIWKGRIVAARKGKGCRTAGIYSLSGGKLELLRRTGSTSVDGTDIRDKRLVWVGGGFSIGLLDLTGRKKERTLYRDPPGEGEGTVVGSAAFGSEGRVHHVWSSYLEGDPTRYAILRRGPRDCERANRAYTVPADTNAPGIDSVAVDGGDLYYVQAGTLYRAADPPLRYSACRRDQR